MATINFAKYKETILKINLAKGKELGTFESLKYASDDKYAAYYIPFEHVNQQAKLVIVGITPAVTQMFSAVQAVQDAKAEGLSDTDALIAAKYSGSFSGMREKLSAMLDTIGLNKKLGIKSCKSLFDEDAHLVQWTSTLRNPIYEKNAVGELKPFNKGKDILKRPFLTKQFNDFFVEDIKLLPNAYYLVLGDGLSDILPDLVKRNLLKTDQALGVIPHPSGANNERIACFTGEKKDGFSIKTDPAKIQAMKQALIAKVKSMPPLG